MTKNKPLFSITTLLFFLLTACASNTHSSINVALNSTPKFEGKAAGASAALMGVMGSMGAAVGVAIDVGIAKDINESAAQRFGDDAIVKAIQSQDAKCFTNEPTSIMIDDLTFRLIANDNARAHFAMTVKYKDQPAEKYDTNKVEDALAPKLPLDSLRFEGESPTLVKETVQFLLCNTELQS